MTDWVKLDSAIESLNLNYQLVSLQAGHSHGWLHSMKRRKSEFKAKDVRALSKILGFNDEETEIVFFATNVD